MTVANPRAAEVGNYEAHVGSHIIPTPESEGGCWRYTGQALTLAEVRRYVLTTLTGAHVDDDTRLRATCGTRGCVRPEHLEAK